MFLPAWLIVSGSWSLALADGLVAGASEWGPAIVCPSSGAGLPQVIQEPGADFGQAQRAEGAEPVGSIRGQAQRIATVRGILSFKY